MATRRIDHRTPPRAILSPNQRAGYRATDSADTRSLLPARETVRGDAGGEDSREAIDEVDVMKGGWPDETVRLLENWAAWLANDRKPVSQISPFPAYRLSGRGKRTGNVIPIIGIEAEKADRIISAMTPRYQQPLRLHYGWKETTRDVRSKAQSCNCAINTYYDRLSEAHAMFERAWYAVVCMSLKSSV